MSIFIVSPAFTKASVFFVVVCKLPPSALTLSARKLEADVYDLISSPGGLPKPS